MKPKFLFTLGGDLGDHIISEPEGWASIIFNLERDLTYWSLIENFELPLIFYGTSEGRDGGYSYLKSAANNGIDTLVTIDIRVSFDDGNTYELCFDGRIDISTAKETIYRAKIQAAIVRNDVWNQFMVNKSKPIDLLSFNDIYGNSRIQIPVQVLNLSSQKIYKQYIADLSSGTQFFDGKSVGAISGKYFQYDWDEEVLSEIQTKFSIPIDINSSVPSNIFELDEHGDYNIYIRIEASLFSRTITTPIGPPCNSTDVYSDCESYVDFYFKIDDSSELIFSSFTAGSGSNKSTVFEFSLPFPAIKGEPIYIYGKLKSNLTNDNTHFQSLLLYGKSSTIDIEIPPIGTFGSFCLFPINSVFTTLTNAAPSGHSNPTQISFSGNTTYIDTKSETVLLHDAGLSICDRILGKDNSFYSEFSGGLNSAIKYSENGCGYLNAITRGLNIRGYNFDEKPFTLNFDDYWSGVNPIFNLGLGYEGTSNEFDNPDFSGGTINPWLQTGDASFREAWVWSFNGQITCDGTLHGDNFRDSKYLYQIQTLGWEQGLYRIQFTGRNVSTGPNANEVFCSVFASNDVFVTPILQVSSPNIHIGLFEFSLTFSLSSNYTALGFTFSIGAPGNVLIMNLNEVKIITSFIRLEPKSYFFNTTPSVYLTGINDITTEFDLALFTKTIQIGCETWNAESISGIDDPQTNHIYNLRYQLVGKDEKQLSKFIAASLAIEQTRRLTKVQSQDWRLDENIFIVSLSEQDSAIIPETSPPTITQQPELISSGISGLTNSETKYNIRHTPARFLDRWSDFYSGQMQSYLGDSFKFASGEGNILMSWIGDGGCDSGTLTENQNIPISSNYLFLPIVYSFTHPLTWDEYTSIRNNRKNAISISWELEGVTYTKIAFVKKLGYDINKSKGTFEVWIRS